MVLGWRGRIASVLVSIHDSISANAMQGTGMALEDAHALAAAIGEHGATEAALRAYEASRVPRIRHISDTVMVRAAPALHGLPLPAVP